MPRKTSDYQSRYYAEHRDEKLSASRRWQQEHAEEKKKYLREYYAANKHKWNKRTPEQREKYNANRRAKYRDDPQYRDQQKMLVKAGREKSPHVRHAHQLRRFGLTLADYNRMLAEQNGCCAICRNPQADKRTKRYHVDHCHATGRVRGLLCSSCNLGLGKFHDDAERLERAVVYLRAR